MIIDTNNDNGAVRLIIEHPVMVMVLNNGNQQSPYWMTPHDQPLAPIVSHRLVHSTGLPKIFHSSHLQGILWSSQCPEFSKW